MILAALSYLSCSTSCHDYTQSCTDYPNLLNINILRNNIDSSDTKSTMYYSGQEKKHTLIEMFSCDHLSLVNSHLLCC